MRVFHGGVVGRGLRHSEGGEDDEGNDAEGDHGGADHLGASDAERGFEGDTSKPGRRGDSDVERCNRQCCGEGRSCVSEPNGQRGGYGGDAHAGEAEQDDQDDRRDDEGGQRDQEQDDQGRPGGDGEERRQGLLVSDAAGDVGADEGSHSEADEKQRDSGVRDAGSFGEQRGDVAVGGEESAGHERGGDEDEPHAALSKDSELGADRDGLALVFLGRQDADDDGSEYCQRGESPEDAAPPDGLANEGAERHASDDGEAHAGHHHAHGSGSVGGASGRGGDDGRDRQEGAGGQGGDDSSSHDDTERGTCCSDGVSDREDDQRHDEGRALGQADGCHRDRRGTDDHADGEGRDQQACLCDTHVQV